MHKKETIKIEKNYKKTRRYLRNSILEQIIRIESETPDSPWAFMKKSEKRKQMDDVGAILNHFKEIPQNLYKYRVCNEYNFSALEKTSVWLSSADDFLDPYDCRLPFTISELPDKKINKLMKWFLFSEYIYGYEKENLSKYEYAFTPQEVRKIMFSKCYNDELFYDSIKIKKFIKANYDSTEHKKIAVKFSYFDKIISRYGRGEKLREWFRKDCEEGCKETIGMHRADHFVCCLTETNDNPKMWEEYADKYQGFCIAFDFSKGVRSDLLEHPSCIAALQSISPVFYVEKRPRFDSYKYQLKQYKETFYERKKDYWDSDFAAELMMQNLIKSKFYENEQEWRIVVGGEEPGLLWFPFVSAIYLGKNISIENKNKLLKIAEKININVYQQEIATEGFVYRIIQKATPKETIWSGTVRIPYRDLS